MNKAVLDRRQFLVTALGGGIALTVSQTVLAAGGKPWGDQAAATGTVELSAMVSIAPDDTVTIHVVTPEIGNGVATQLAMTVTEELNCDWSKVQMAYLPAARDYRDGHAYSQNSFLGYFGGRSTEESRTQLLLQAGASVRERLKAAAATEWQVPAVEITAKDSVLTHTPSGRTLRYGEMAAKAADVKLEAEPSVKPQSEWTFLGKASPSKLNLPFIVNGSATYGIDVRPEGLVYAALQQSPVHGGKLKSYDASAVMKMPGVLAVVTVDPSEPRGMPEGINAAPHNYDQTEPQSAVAVIAEHYWQARKALDALPVEWDDGPGAAWKSDAQIREAAFALLEKETDKPILARGNVSILDDQPKIVEAAYSTPYCDQACMEPLNGTALVTDDKVELWHPSQQSMQALWVAADETRIDPAKVVVHQTYVGGGFGRRIYGNDFRMVVAIAKKFPGRPVQVIWSREEMMRQGRYRHLAAAKLRAGLDADGMPQAFVARTAAQKNFMELGLHTTPYVGRIIPNVRCDRHTLPMHILTGPYRGPGYNSHSFMIETFIDECAHAAGMDGLAYRLKLLANWPDKGWETALKIAAAKAGWGKPLPKGVAHGIAISNWGSYKGAPFAGTTVAAVATVEVTTNGNAKVHALDVAFDCGRMMNRDAVLNEVEGGVIFGYNMAMNEGLSIKDGRIVEDNFDRYPIAHMADLPKINIHMDAVSGHERHSEIGEPPVGPIGPAIGNAIFKASGIRLRSTPFRHSELNWA